MGEAYVNLYPRIERVPIAEPLSPAWYAVQTSYRYELRLERDLTAKGFETYLPLLREVHRWTDRRKIVDVPAFSGYLFVRYESSLQNRVKVLETSGVVRLLGGNHAPIAVPDQEIEALRLTLSSGVPCEHCDALTPGTLVRVVRGPLAGAQGRLLRIKNNIRIVIAISLVSQAISAELELSDVEAVSDRSTAVYTDQL